VSEAAGASPNQWYKGWCVPLPVLPSTFQGPKLAWQKMLPSNNSTPALYVPSTLTEKK